MTELTVTTWNVLYRDLDRRLPLQVERLNAIRPDVLLLQETNAGHAHALAERIGMRVAAIAPDADGVADVLPAVLVREPAVDAGVRTLPLPGDGRRRHYVYTDVRVADRAVRCATTHLQHTHRAGQMGFDADYAAAGRGELAVDRIAHDEIRSSALRRLEELALIADERAALDPLPEIFGGDLNFVAHGPEYRRILSWGMADSWSASPRLGSGATIIGANPLIGDGPHSYDHEIATMFPGHVGTIDYTLDYLFHTGELTAGRAWTFGTAEGPDDWPSDHLGLTVQYDL